MTGGVHRAHTQFWHLSLGVLCVWDDGHTGLHSRVWREVLC